MRVKKLELAPIISKLHISHSLSCCFAIASMLNFSLSQYHFFSHAKFSALFLLSRSTFFFFMFISVFFVFCLPYIVNYLNVILNVFKLFVLYWPYAI